MKKIITFLLSVTLLMSCVNMYAQNPFCEILRNPVAGNTLKPTDKTMRYTGQKSYRNAHFEEEGCNFTFLLEDPIVSWGWSSSNGIQITVDGVDYGIVTLPWGGGGYAEEIRKLPSGEVQFRWLGDFSYPRHCFEIYNSLDSMIYKSDKYLPDELFLIYPNECPYSVECFPITDFEGVYIAEEDQVNLTWKAPESTDLIGFDIYRNDVLIDSLPPSTVSFSDNTKELDNGNYKYCVIPVYPIECDLDEKCFETNINVGVINYKDNITIYPNPATNLITISSNRVLAVKVYNNIGQLILNEYNTNEINVSKLTNGIYILSVEISAGNTIQKKIIINR